MSKKHNLRFCLRMNPCDPTQVASARILNTKGHGISEFVARAIMYYAVKNEDELKAAGILFPTEKKPENDVTSAPQTDALAVKKEPDSMRAMLDGLGNLLPVKKP